MADIKTRGLTRAKISAWVGRENNELVKFVEDLTSDLQVSIPAAIRESTAGDAQAVISASVFLPKHEQIPANTADAQAITAMAAFLPRQNMQFNPADAQNVLAGQIFGA